jgi:hypothetical protein
LGRGGGGQAVAQTMYACVSKCKNDKIQKNKPNQKLPGKRNNKDLSQIHEMETKVVK